MIKIFKMQDLDCANCAAKMEADINALPQVNSARVNFMSQKMKLDVQDGTLDEVLAEAQKICKRYEPDCIILC